MQKQKGSLAVTLLIIAIFAFAGVSPSRFAAARPMRAAPAV